MKWDVIVHLRADMPPAEREREIGRIADAIRYSDPDIDDVDINYSPEDDS